MKLVGFLSFLFSVIFITPLLTTPLSVCADDEINQIQMPLGTFVSGLPPAEQPHSSVKPMDPDKLNNIKDKGWQHIYSLLIQDGVEQNQLIEILNDPLMPANSELLFSLNPKESDSLYRQRTSEREVKNALSFYNQYQDIFKQQQARFQIPEGIVLAILQIETYCGKHTGNEIIFYRLARLASAASPENIEKNFTTKCQADPKLTKEKVALRAKWLEDTFLPHTKALITLAQSFKLNPLELKGSGSGALGIPQFLPGHYFNYGVDADNDGQINPFSPADAILSTANYLKANGWNSNKMTQAEKLKVIWTYNRSKPYGQAVLTLAQKIQNKLDHPWTNSLKSTRVSAKH